MSKDTNKLYS